uniref:glutathione transferase n=1 Tax=Bos indicus x Bos taurus TaxID=30522 RepID=A0A4W2E190_BOBOX
MSRKTGARQVMKTTEREPQRQKVCPPNWLPNLSILEELKKNSSGGWKECRPFVYCRVSHILDTPPSHLAAPSRLNWLGCCFCRSLYLHCPSRERGMPQGGPSGELSLTTWFDEEFLETKEQLQKLQDGNHLLFQQVPMVEIDGMKLVQTRSILHYIADKHHLFGKDLKERTLIDMYVEGTLDLLELLIMHPFLKPDDQQKEVANMAQKAIIRYFPVFEKVLRGHGQRFLVGNQLSLADIILLQTILALEEKIPNILSAFPHLQEYTVKISNIPTIKKFLEPGSKKKPPPDDIYVRTVYNIFMP